MKKILILIALLFFGFGFSQNNTIENNPTFVFPEIHDFVNDYDDILSLSQEVILKAYAKEIEKQNNIGIVIVTVPSISPYTDIYDYSLDLAKQTTFGCIVIVVCKNMRALQIQNCDAIVSKLTDEETKSIIDHHVIPEFKKGNYFIGLENGIREIKKELQ
ncbi:TPM domain-containing protein [Flavobacterium sp. CAU 1735]|uniref:TPM domain-containing protein n=1 Tax=Flavobacterium sp. CAU 1735 TaxID=3140361 RepID=UPI0032600E61